MHVSRLCEEAGEPEENPHRHKENTERPPGIEPATFLLQGVPPTISRQTESAFLHF